MSDRRQDVLRLQPEMIPALRTVLAQALTRLDTTLAELRRGGTLSEPWLGDESSSEVAAYYTQRAMDGADSSFHALVAYRNELNSVHDTLGQMEDHYRRTEGENAAVWGQGRKA